MKYGIILTVIGLSACSTKNEKIDPKPAVKVEKAVVKESLEKMLDKTPIKKILMSESGVGRLGRAAVFNISTIEAAYPGYTVEVDERMAEGSPYKIFTVKENDTLLMEISSYDQKEIGRILVKSDVVVHETGEKIGSTFKNVFPDPKSANCIMGEDDWGHVYLCNVPKADNLRYHFVSNEKGKHKPNENWVIESIDWRPSPKR